MAKRVEWIDIVKGVAVLTVLFWHASSIPAVLTGGYLSKTMFLVNEPNQLWQMPVLMFASGIFVSYSLRRGTVGFLLTKVRTIMWPFAIFAAFNIAFFQPHLWNTVTGWVIPVHLWFLSMIMVYFVLAPLLTRLPAWVVLPVLLIAAFVLNDKNFIIHLCSYHAFYFYAGHYMRDLMPRVISAPREFYYTALGLGVAFTLVAMWQSHGEHHVYLENPVGYPFIILLILVSVRMAADIDARWGSTRAVRFLKWSGRESLVLYLVHFHVQWLFFMFLNHLGLGYRSIYMVPAFLIGLGVSAVFVYLKRWIPFKWLFEGPAVIQFVKGLGAKEDAVASDAPRPRQ